MSSKFIAVPYRMKVRFSSHTYVLRSTRISLSREDLRMTSLYDLVVRSRGMVRIRHSVAVRCFATRMQMLHIIDSIPPIL